jgi:uncharacterized protein
MQANILGNRLGVFVRLAEITSGNLGRTQLMKLCYFLQAFGGVPLGYSFSLYSYGPFDSEVLSDLQTAEGMNALDTEIQYYPGGYKYDIRPGEKAEKAKALASPFLAEHQKGIDWVANKFGNWVAADLELASTIAYVHEEEGIEDHDELIERVKLVKPHFSHRQIRSQLDWLLREHLLA